MAGKPSARGASIEQILLTRPGLLAIVIRPFHISSRFRTTPKATTREAKGTKLLPILGENPTEELKQSAEHLVQERSGRLELEDGVVVVKIRGDSMELDHHDMQQRQCQLVEGINTGGRTKRKAS